MKNISNKHCYEIEYREYKKGILDDFVDATYIITMKNSKRIINIEAQLKKYILFITMDIKHVIKYYHYINHHMI